MSRDYELFEKTILEGGYLSGSNLDSCRAFVEMGKNEGLNISQVCEILVSDNFVTREQIDEILTQIGGGEGPPAADENQEAEIHEYKSRLEDLRNKCNPILQRASGGDQNPPTPPDSNHQGPEVDEVD